MSGRMLVISGPSGSGKSTICKRLLEDPRVVFSVSATTRTKRAGEVEGRDYHFLTPAEFERRVQAGEFIEHAEVYGNLYGTLRKPLEKAIAAGQLYLLEIDVQGANQLRALGEPGTYVFIASPSHAELRRRMEQRGSETPETLERRLRKAADEAMLQGHYDHVVVNDELERAVAEVRRLTGLDPQALPASARAPSSPSERSSKGSKGG